MRVGTGTLDRFLSTVGEVILSSNQLRSSAETLNQNAAVSAGFDRMERRVSELQRRVLDLRTTPLLRVMESLPRVARQVASDLGKRVQVELKGAELELDRSILDRLNDPLLHVVRNAVDHGIEAPEDRVLAGKGAVGQLVIEARREKDSIVIEVRDDGGGIDLRSVRDRAVEVGLLHPDLADDLQADEITAFIFSPGLSTAVGVSTVSGRGVGMDAVKATIEALGGSVELQTVPGAGTSTKLVVPITAAVQRVLLVAVAGERVALPISKIERITEVEADAIEGSDGETFALIEDEPVLVIDVARRIALESTNRANELVPLVLTDIRGERVALRVDSFVGQEEIYVKPLPEVLSKVPILAGLTILGDGSPVFLLDLNHLA